MRIRLEVEYDGTDYAGWQRQKEEMTVQQRLEEALGSLLQQPIVIHGAGRTDAGVHAMRMTCHFDCQTRIPPDRIAYAVNYALPSDIRVCASEQVADDFHARFDAAGKWYRYRILHRQQAAAIHRRICAHVPGKLDVDAMARALPYLEGTHDFAAFAASGSHVKSTVRTIYAARLHRAEDMIWIDVVGSGFLYNMVRIIAGTAIDVGKGKQTETVFSDMIATGSRLSGGMTAPARGLTLMRVFYPPMPDIAQIETMINAGEML
ncbi:MAG: tRNA pseudouridine(38-40) synthase TruA [Clostridia bacterium]|nr:tRNA pseudouridine(38-40) synthase TruA [Clostridia bacterium]